MKPTYLDIQKITGLSLSTISKYLNGGNVLPENKKAIDKAIKQLDYHINDYARGLRSKRSKSIGLLIPELESTFHTTIMSHIARTLRKHGYACIVYTCDGNPENEADAVAFLLSKMVDGIISIPMEKSGKHFYAARERGVPVVLVDRKTTDFRTDSVTIDNFSAGEMAAKHIYDHGHRDIGIICGPLGIYTMEQRRKGFAHFLEQNNCVNDKFLISTEFSIGGGYEAAMQLLQQNIRPSALFCANYELTTGTVMALRSLDIKYPEDISLVGFDNMFLSELVTPSLSMIAQPMEEIAASAAKIMLNKLNQEDVALYNVELPVTLLLGDSVKTVKAP